MAVIIQAPDDNHAPGIAASATMGIAYERIVRREILRPYLNGLTAAIDAAPLNYTSILGSISAYNSGAGVIDDNVLISLVRAEVQGNAASHTRLFRQTVGKRIPLGPDFLNQDSLRNFMEARIGENVRLIKTIPPRLHDRLTSQMLQLAESGPLRAQELRALIRDEYLGADWNMRRIVRDQITKQVGELNYIRQVQAGIPTYTYRTVGDDKVRLSHEAHNDLVFSWAGPDPDTGKPGTQILCRCVGLPILP